MMRGWTAAALAVALLAMAPARAHAEHLTLMPDARGGDPATPGLDLRFRIGDGGFHLGGRVLADGGVYGAWLDGHADPGGFTLEGRVEEPGRDHGITLDSRKLEALLGDALRGLRGFSSSPW